MGLNKPSRDPLKIRIMLYYIEHENKLNAVKNYIIYQKIRKIALGSRSQSGVRRFFFKTSKPITIKDLKFSFK